MGKNTNNNTEEKPINVNGNIPKQSEFFWRHGRQLLRQYLNEVGYTDAILDVRAKRLRALLKKNEIIWSENEALDTGKGESGDGSNNSLQNPDQNPESHDAPLENLKTMQ